MRERWGRRRARRGAGLGSVEVSCSDLGDEVSEVLELAHFWEKGMMPAAGGVLDQAAGLVSAVRFVHGERDRVLSVLSVMREMDDG